MHSCMVLHRLGKLVEGFRPGVTWTKVCGIHVRRGETPKSVRFKNALIITKLSRYEFEKRRHPHLSDEELQLLLRERGSDYGGLLYHHNLHKATEKKLVDALTVHGINVRLIHRWEYTDSSVNWADVIWTAGGDGTFLLAASRIQDCNKTVIGINSDPSRSEGYLCLPKEYSTNVHEAVRKIVSGRFRWRFRQRLRVILDGPNVYEPPIELHDQQLMSPEYRYFECLSEQHISVTEVQKKKNKQRRVLPVLALNEVFIGETLSARVSYLEVTVDSRKSMKLKSSGLLLSTGTGSTSWTFNINKLTHQSVEELLRVIRHKTGFPLDNTDPELVDDITTTFNNNLLFHPEHPVMVYTLRDPVSVGTIPSPTEKRPRGIARRVDIRSRCFDACLVIDGGLSFPFNDGTAASIEIHDNDALRTVVLHED